MERIFRHAIDQRHTDGCKPIPLNIGIYIDGYGAYLSAKTLYELSDKNLSDDLRSQVSGDSTLYNQLYDRFHIPYGPEVYAEIISFCLALVELQVIADVEKRYRAAGTPIRPNALLVNQSNPVNIELKGSTYNVLEAFFPFTEEQWQAGHYLDVACIGTIYSPRKIDRLSEISQLKRELAKASRYGDLERMKWIELNLSTVSNGVLHRRYKDGSVSGPVDFNFTECFYDAVADRVGYYSRLGQSKVHWGKGLSDFGEKGVDCDLIMQVLDDLHAGTVDVFVFMTNDMDFLPLIERIQDEGKSVFLCGLGSRVSTRLREAVGDAFFDLTKPNILDKLHSVFMATDVRAREVVLQLAFMTMMRDRDPRG